MVERAVDWTAEAMGGAVIAGRADGRWRGAAIDSRRLAAGELFFALRGEHADGHDYALDAARRGAAGVVVQRPVDDAPVAGEAWIRVDDTFRALHDLTRAVRAEVPERLVGITGSAGKTTTKDLLTAILGRRFRVASSPGNFNNLYGFPLALLAVPDDCQWMVAEMGMSTPGELSAVSRLGRPDVAVFTNVRAAHLENFPDLDGIADAKAELLDGLSADGLVIANADDPRVMDIARRFPGRVVTYGIERPADVRGRHLEVLASAGDPRPGSRFELVTGDGAWPVELPIHGLYNVENCLAAAACGLALGVAVDDVRRAVAAFRPSSMRGEVHRLASGPTVIDDSYNSNPDAAVKALDSARRLPARRHLAVLGDMLELGPEGPEMHRQVGRRAVELGYHHVLAVGELARHLADGVGEAGGRADWVADAADAVEWLRAGDLGSGDLVLIKGSRGVGLDRAVAALVAGPEQGGGD